MINFIKSNRINLIFIIILLIGTYLRVEGLGNPSFWYDEGLSTSAAINILEKGYPPTLYNGTVYWRSVAHTSLMAAFLKIFGVNEFSARLPSVIFGILTMILMFLFGKEIRDKKLGIIAALLVSTSIFEIQWNREARMYAMFQFMFFLSLFFFYRWYKRDSIKELLAAFFCTFIAILTHVGGYIIVPIIYGFLAILFLMDKKYLSRIRNENKILLGTILFFVSIFFIYKHDMITSFYYSEVFWDYNGNPLIFYSDYLWDQSQIIMIFFLVGTVACLYYKKKDLFLPWAFFLPFFIQVIFINRVLPRYFYHLFGIYLLIAAIGVYTILEITLQRTTKKFVIPVVILGLILAISPVFVSDLNTPYHEEWRSTYRYVVDNSGKKISLISTDEPTLQFYLGNSNYGLKSQKEISIYPRSVLSNREELEDIMKKSDTLWIISDNSRWYWEDIIPKENRNFIKENFLRIDNSYNMIIFKKED